MSTTRESPVSIRVRESKRREHSLWQQFELSSPFPSSVAGRHDLPPFGKRTLQRIHRDGGVTAAAARRRDVHEVYTYGTLKKKYAGSRSVTWEIPSTHILLARRWLQSFARFQPLFFVEDAKREERRRGRGQDVSHITLGRRRKAEGATVRPALVPCASPDRLSIAHGRWSYHSIEVVRLDDIVLRQPWQNFLAFTTDAGALSLLLTHLASLLADWRSLSDLFFFKFCAGIGQFCLLQPQLSVTLNKQKACAYNDFSMGRLVVLIFILPRNSYPALSACTAKI